MRNKLIYTMALALLVIGFQGCKPEPKVLGPKVSQLDGIAGNWVLSKVDQIDVNVQLAFVESDTLLDVSDVILDASVGAPMEINFDKGKSTFSVTSGTGSDMINFSAGTWNFDNNEYPSYLIFDKGLSTEKNFKMIHPVRPQDPYLIMNVNKICGNKRTVSYHLWFTRKN